ncbi:hypothetical protein ACOZ4N_03260 [Halorientalis pallida]
MGLNTGRSRSRSQKTENWGQLFEIVHAGGRNESQETQVGGGSRSEE